MTIPDVLALDFDGVCCDGLREYFETSRRTCARVWPADPPPPESAFVAFSALRPVILSGWEMPVLLRAITRGVPRAEILGDWERVRDELVAAGSPAGDGLIARRGHARDLHGDRPCHSRRARTSHPLRATCPNPAGTARG